MIEINRLAALRRANTERQAEWPGGEKVSTPFRAVELMGEAGELVNLVKKFYRLTEDITGTTETKNQLQIKLADELADVVVCLDLVCMTAGADSLRFPGFNNFSVAYIVKLEDLLMLGNLLGSRVGKICDMAFERHRDREELHFLCCEALLAVGLIAAKTNVNLYIAMNMKFNATSAKHGLKTRMK
jgi:NTP pyrophosphatase (non-canonical NTP hydrolase)